MRIGLVRHFKVVHPYPKQRLLDRLEVGRWFAAYETAEVAPYAAGLHGIAWRRCISSPQKRALDTAGRLFAGAVEHDEALRELDIIPTLRSNVRLPFLVWAIVVRIKSGRRSALTIAFDERVRDFVDRLLATDSGDLLVVGHHFVLMRLQRELQRRGLSGERFRSPVYGQVYVWQRPG